MTTTTYCKNFAERFQNAISIYGERKAIFWKVGDKYESITGNKLKEIVYLLSTALEKLGLKPGDKAAIISESRFEWVASDFACIMNGVITIPIFTTMTVRQIKYILEHSGAKICFTSNQFLTEKLIRIFDELPYFQKIVTFNKIDSQPDYVTSFEKLIDSANTHTVQEYNEEIVDKYFMDCTEKINPEDLLTIIYTSGTTGIPKGVALTHKNILTNVDSCIRSFDISSADRFLSFLPLAHSYERSTGYYCAFSAGAEIFYAQNIDTLPAQFIEVKPTFVTAVPFFYSKMYNRVMQSVKTLSGVKRFLFFRAHKFAIISYNNKRGLRWKFYDKFVYKKIRERLGGRIRILISGGSALNQEVNKMFNGIGLTLLEGYGLTETSPVIAVNRPDRNKIGTVGIPLDCIQVKIADDGEILIKGDTVMVGYYKNEEETAKTIIGGWLHTGDIGELDKEGFLKITDRKKSLIKSEGGEYISLTHIEETLENSEYISQVISFAGDDKPFVSALIVPNFEMLHEYAKKHDIVYSNNNVLVSSSDINKLIENEISKHQQNQAKYERVRKFALLDHSFTIESEEITPTLKIKRKVIENKYKDLIESLYKIK